MLHNFIQLDSIKPINPRPDIDESKSLDGNNPSHILIPPEWLGVIEEHVNSKYNIFTLKQFVIHTLYTHITNGKTRSNINKLYQIYKNIDSPHPSPNCADLLLEITREYRLEEYPNKMLPALAGLIREGNNCPDVWNTHLTLDNTHLKADEITKEELNYFSCTMNCFTRNGLPFKQFIRTFKTDFTSLIGSCLNIGGNLSNTPKGSSFIKKQIERLDKECNKIVDQFDNRFLNDLVASYTPFKFNRFADLTLSFEKNKGELDRRNIKFFIRTTKCLKNLLNTLVRINYEFENFKNDVDSINKKAKLLCIYCGQENFNSIENHVQSFEDFCLKTKNDPKVLVQSTNTFLNTCAAQFPNQIIQLVKFINSFEISSNEFEEKRQCIEMGMLFVKASLELIKKREAAQESRKLLQANSLLADIQRQNLEATLTNLNLAEPVIKNEELSNSASVVLTQEKKSETMEENDVLQSTISEPLHAFCQQFEQIPKLLTNRYAKKAAQATSKLASMITKELDDATSAVTDAHLAEHLTGLLINLSLVGEQFVTSIFLEQANPEKKPSHLDHSQGTMIDDLLLPKNLSNKLRSLSNRLDMAEIADRDVYHISGERSSTLSVATLLKRCESLRLGKLKQQQKQNLQKEIYELIENSFATLSTASTLRFNLDPIIKPKSSLISALKDHTKHETIVIENHSTRLLEGAALLEKSRQIIQQTVRYSKKPEFVITEEWKAMLLNADRYLALAIARLERASESKNVSAFCLSLNRYLYQALAQVAMATADKSGAVDLSKIPKDERPHSVWHWLYSCRLEESEFSPAQETYLDQTADLNHIVRYLGINSSQNKAKSNVQSAANRSEIPLIQLLAPQSVLQSDQWQLSVKNNKIKKSRTLCHNALNQLNDVAGIIDLFLTELLPKDAIR